jgi:lambda family phage tail tape measure protein
MGGFLLEASDSLTQLKNRTKVFASSQKDANVRMAGAIGIARKMNSTIEESAGIMQRVSIAQKSAGFSTKELIKITENLTMASLLSGATTQESEGALRQFAQGMAANRLAGQELNSVLEQTPLVAVALADGLTKMGKFGKVAAGDLRRLGEAGELTTEVLVKIFGQDIPELMKMFEKFVMPLERLVTSLKREATLFIGQWLDLSGANDIVRDTLIKVKDKLVELNTVMEEGGPARTELINKIKTAAYVIGTTLAAMALPFALAGLVALTAFIFSGGGILVAVGALTGLMIANRETAFELGGQTITLTSLWAAMTKEVHKPETEETWLESLVSDGIMNQFVAGLTVAFAKAKQLYHGMMALLSAQSVWSIKKDLASGNLPWGYTREDVEAELAHQEADWKHHVDEMQDIGSAGEIYTGVINQLKEDGGVVANVKNSLIAVAGTAKAAAADVVGEAIIDAAAEAHRITAEAAGKARQEREAFLKKQAAADDLKDKIAKEREAEAELDRIEKAATLRREAAAEDYEKLRSSYDASYAAQLKFRDAMVIVNEARESEHITMQQAILDQQALKAAMDEVLSEEMFEKLEGMAAITAGAQKGISDMVESLGSPAELMAGGFQDVLSETTNAIANFVATGEMDFKAFGRSIVKIISKMIIEMLVLKALQAALGVISPGVGGGSSGVGTGMSLNSGSSTGLSTSNFRMMGVGGNAMGGPVTTGQPVMVGEKGPELFVPPSGGSIVNNRELGMARPQVNVSVINVDDPSSVPRAMSSDEGEEVVMNIISRNSDALREIA